MKRTTRSLFLVVFTIGLTVIPAVGRADPPWLPPPLQIDDPAEHFANELTRCHARVCMDITAMPIASCVRFEPQGAWRCTGSGTSGASAFSGTGSDGHLSWSGTAKAEICYFGSCTVVWTAPPTSGGCDWQGFRACGSAQGSSFPSVTASGCFSYKVTVTTNVTAHANTGFHLVLCDNFNLCGENGTTVQNTVTDDDVVQTCFLRPIRTTIVNNIVNPLLDILFPQGMSGRWL
jgi:hypothetical protein